LIAPVLSDNTKRACRQASAAQGTLLGGFVLSELSAVSDLESVKLCRAGGNAAAAAAAFLWISDDRRICKWNYLALPHSGSSGCFHVVRRSSGSGEYCGHEAMRAMAVCLHFRLQVLQRRFISASFSFMG
jgi:hypothetical protein